MGFSEASLQAIHEVREAMGGLERAADALQSALYPGLATPEDCERIVEKLMALRTKLAELACEIQASRPAKRRI
jgi:hypothetical protein